MFVSDIPEFIKNVQVEARQLEYKNHKGWLRKC